MRRSANRRPASVLDLAMARGDRAESSPAADGPRRVRSTLRHAMAALSAREPLLWAVAVGALLVDLGLTVYGLGLGLHEQNLLAIRLLERFGIGGLGLLKTAALGVGLAVRTSLPSRFVFVVPLALSLPWLAAALVNLYVIVQTVGWAP